MRLPSLIVDSSDQVDFNLPEESLPPPRTGDTIEEPFPPPGQHLHRQQLMPDLWK